MKGSSNWLKRKAGSSEIKAFDLNFKRRYFYIMANESYKNWIAFGIIFLSAVVIIVSVITKAPERGQSSRGTAREPAMSSGPLLDDGSRQITPVEELGIDMNNPESLASSGDRYFEQGNFAQAVEIYKKVIELDPGHADTYNDLGLAYFYLRNHDLAIETLKKATDTAPNMQRAWLSYGFVLMSLGKNSEAGTVLSKAIEINPDSEVGVEAKRMLDIVNQGPK
jgi:tetratricopeptide (TPR) repeat protein